MNLNKLKATLPCKIFDTVISLILTNNRKIWGVHAKSDFKTWDVLHLLPNVPEIKEKHLMFKFIAHCTFQKHANSVVQNPTDTGDFLLPSII